jgi:hypothetical protein
MSRAPLLNIKHPTISNLSSTRYCKTKTTRSQPKSHENKNNFEQGFKNTRLGEGQAGAKRPSRSQIQKKAGFSLIPIK